MKLRILICAIAAVVSALAAVAAEPGKSPAERGALAVRGRPALSPPLWSTKSFENVWKQWGLKEKPADYARAIEERYGLQPAAYDNGNLPMGLHASQGLLGKGVINDCLMCHAGRIAGQTIIGLGNASLDLQGLFDDLTAEEGLPFKLPVQVGYVRGTVDPVNPVIYLVEFRNPEDLSLRTTPARLGYSKNIASDPPAWW